VIKGSHFGATPWRSYWDGLSTHQFGGAPSLISISVDNGRTSSCGQAPPSPEVCWAGEHVRGVGPALGCLELAGGRSVAWATSWCWQWRLIDKGATSTDVKLCLDCLWSKVAGLLRWDPQCGYKGTVEGIVASTQQLQHGWVAAGTVPSCGWMDDG